MNKENDITDLWRALAFENWDSVPFIKDRIAIEEDVKAGCAVFYLEKAENHTSLNITIPSLVHHVDEETGEKRLAIVIQGEKSEENELVGLRYFDGGNAICMLHEIEFV